MKRPAPVPDNPPQSPPKPPAPTREDRLAEKLRENLRRRKLQARALDAHGAGISELGSSAAPPLPKDGPSG